MSRPDSGVPVERLNVLPRLPRANDGPVFAEPWEAQAFALAVELCEQGYFTWSEWASALGYELKAAADRGEPDDGSHYYEHWLAALEHLVTAKGLTDRAALEARNPGPPRISAHPTASPSNWRGFPRNRTGSRQRRRSCVITPD